MSLPFSPMQSCVWATLPVCATATPFAVQAVPLKKRGADGSQPAVVAPVSWNLFPLTKKPQGDQISKKQNRRDIRPKNSHMVVVHSGGDFGLTQPGP